MLNSTTVCGWVNIGVTKDAQPLLFKAPMPKKIKIEIDFDIGDRVFLDTDDKEQIPGIVTQIIFTGVEAMYQVARGMDDKICSVNELSIVVEP